MLGALTGKGRGKGRQLTDNQRFRPQTSVNEKWDPAREGVIAPDPMSFARGSCQIAGAIPPRRRHYSATLLPGARACYCLLRSLTGPVSAEPARSGLCVCRGQRQIGSAARLVDQLLKGEPLELSGTNFGDGSGGARPDAGAPPRVPAPV